MKFMILLSKILSSFHKTSGYAIYVLEISSVNNSVQPLCNDCVIGQVLSLLKM